MEVVYETKAISKSKTKYYIGAAEVEWKRHFKKNTCVWATENRQVTSLFISIVGTLIVTKKKRYYMESTG